MADKILNLEWEDVIPGHRIRWVTPTFVRQGVILQKKGESLRCQFDGNPGETVIPNAKWYFDLISKGNAIVVIETTSISVPKDMDNFDRWVTPIEAANILGIDAKTVRRQLRYGGEYNAIKRDGKWLIDRLSLKGIDNDN